MLACMRNSMRWILIIGRMEDGGSGHMIYFYLQLGFCRHNMYRYIPTYRYVTLYIRCLMFSLYFHHAYACMAASCYRWGLGTVLEGARGRIMFSRIRGADNTWLWGYRVVYLAMVAKESAYDLRAGQGPTLPASRASSTSTYHTLLA